MSTETIKMFDYLEQYAAHEEQIINAVRRVFRSGELILAREVERFEEDFAAFLGQNMCSVGVANGTDALVVCLMALGIGPGDEVITVANTAVPTVSAIRMVKATPVFVDVDAQTALMDLSKIAAKITPKTRAIIPVHLFGNAVDMPVLMQMAQRHSLAVIEDCAQAHGAMINGRRVGTFGHAAAFSFYPTKNLGAYGDGGLCCTADPALWRTMRRVRKYGFESTYYAEQEGINSRLDEVQAAILNVKLAHLADDLDKRRRLAELYQADLPRTVQHLAPIASVSHAYHLFVVKVPDRDALKHALAQRLIQTGIHYPYPIHRMRGYDFLGYQDGSLPVTEALSAQILSLPLYPTLPTQSVQQVLAALHEILD